MPEIDRLTLRLPGLTAAEARLFARAWQEELAQTGLPVPGSGGELARLVVPPLQWRPGESPRLLARRAALALRDALAQAPERAP